MKIFFIFVIIIALNQSVIFCEEVTIPELGTLKGSTTKSAWSEKIIYQFLGVPYAEPPIGNLRYKAPHPKSPFTSLFDATSPGLDCPDVINFTSFTPEQLNAAEDCLHLSVFTLNLNKTADLPVMLFIHGGGFESGSSNLYQPHYLLEKDIVYVAINYRLGPLGFLSTQTEDIPGNAGFLDTILALKWVKKYISNFGGNPNAITIFGESAGAGLVSALMLSSDKLVSHDLFQRAILQSGSFFGVWAFDSNPIVTAEKIFNNVDMTKCLPPDNTMEKCFIKLDVFSLFEAYKLNAEKDFFAYGIHSRLSYSKDIFPYKPSEILNGDIEMRNISLMAGTTKHDGLFVLEMIYDKLVKDYDIENNSTFNTYDLINIVSKELGIDDFTGSFNGFAINNLFTQEQLVMGNFTEMLPGIKDLACDAAFKAPTLKAAQAHAKFYPTQTFFYTFDYLGEFSFMRNDSSPFGEGVLHADDCIYLFPFSKLNANDKKMAEQFVDLWTSFAIDGIPKSNNAPNWPSFEKYTGPYFHINSKSTVGNDFLTEFSVIAKEARNGANSIMSNIINFIAISFIVVIIGS